MYLLFFAYFVAFINAISEKCQTPSGLNGECLPLASCQPLLWSFSNPKDGMVEYLEKFVCSNDTDKGIIVCCHIPADILVFEDEEDDWDPEDAIYDIKKLVNVETCGVQSGFVKSVGEISLHDFPWLVKIIAVDSDAEGTFEKLVCTGVIITERYVLYSAQCHSTLKEIASNYYIKLEFYNGYKSNCNTTSSSYSAKCSTFFIYFANHFVVHPFYDPITKLNDIAIMRLYRRIPFSEFMRPICLPLLPDLFKLREMHTSGWNRTFHKTDITVKSTYTSTAISNYDCKLSYELEDVITTYDMCTVNNTSAFSEATWNPVTSFYKNQWYILGFTSRGKEPKIHTRVQNYLQWIKESMGGERCLTPHNETGECIQITECPRLFKALTNPNPLDEDYLSKFLCEYVDDDEDYLNVCCGYSTNFTILVNATDDEPKSYNISNSRICGLQHRDDYISTDDTISIDEFPWLAAIINATLPSQRDFICGGSLITERYVLSSFQCANLFDDKDTMLVRLGDYNLKTEIDCLEVVEYNAFECADVQEFAVEKTITHPFYNDYEKNNDICLFRLNKQVKFSDYVRPICLPTSDDDLMLFGETFYTTGFGSNDKESEGTRIKKKIPTILIPFEVCNEKYKLLSYIDPTTKYEICTEDFKNSTDVTCTGDEGGPVMYSKKLQWFIYGISSFYSCGDDEPQTHVNVFKYLKWIKFNIED